MTSDTGREGSRTKDSDGPPAEREEQQPIGPVDGDDTEVRSFSDRLDSVRHCQRWSQVPSAR